LIIKRQCRNLEKEYCAHGYIKTDAFSLSGVKLIFYGNWKTAKNPKGLSRTPITNFGRLFSAGKVLKNWWKPVAATCRNVSKPVFIADLVVTKNLYPKKPLTKVEVFRKVIRRVVKPDPKIVYIVIAAR